jgi:Rrf2 family protein
MKITKSADFAIRLILFLAIENKPQTMPKIAEILYIPYNNLSKLVQALSKAGVIQTKQGKNGGIQLLKSPEDISLKTIIDVIDGPTRLSDCLADTRFCALTQTCKLKGVLHDLQHKIDDLLSEVSISKIQNTTI